MHDIIDGSMIRMTHSIDVKFIFRTRGVKMDESDLSET